METTLPSPSTTAVVAGPSSDVSTSAAYDDDARHGHFATVATKAAGVLVAGSSNNNGTLTSAASHASLPSSPELGVKEPRTRFHDDHEGVSAMGGDPESSGPRLRSSRMFKGKGKESLLALNLAAHAEDEKKKKPLRLLDLPLDILKDIIKEVTHTNDLTSLSLCHSALHRLTIPHIYSRFDIVWPDSSTHSEPRSGVDALTYGLATLVMAEEVFGETPAQRAQLRHEREQNNRFMASGTGNATETAIRRRRGNHYAHFTKKFSLGNGPADWVQEYLITKEGGKMLGTLVALAVARMRSLETFIWDMPTGILRDVWLALSSLGDREDGRECRLDKIWVRWHNNSSADGGSPIPPLPPAPLSIPPVPSLLASGAAPPQFQPAQLNRIERPCFSILPPLKSLSVLDIDELAYLDEMAVSIGKSLDKLRELRVGIARHAMTKDWVTVWEGENLRQVDSHHPTLGSLTIGEKRLGGILGTLTGFVTDMRKPKVNLPDRARRRGSSRADAPPTASADIPALTQTVGFDGAIETVAELAHAVANNTPATVQSIFVDSMLNGDSPSTITAGSIDAKTLSALDMLTTNDAVRTEPYPDVDAPLEGHVEAERQEQYLDLKLRLESLELERVPISVPVLQKALDWSCLTSLTLLNCPNHEQLWKTLRKQFAPTAKSQTYSVPRRTPSSSSRRTSRTPPSTTACEIDLVYHLNIKKIHTNTASPALINFLKETLAPNSLQVLFLQEARSHNSPVTIDSILRGPLRRHRASLQKLLIDSSEKPPDTSTLSLATSTRSRRWLLNRETLAFIVSGKMSSLRELGVAISYRDWHFFLQSLPNVPHLRSIYVPFLADHVHGRGLDGRELALQVVDIVALRRDVEVCYLGIGPKCFEILEGKGRGDDVRTESALGVLPTGGEDDVDDDDDDDGDDIEDVEDEEEEVEEEEETESDEDEDDDLDDDDDDIHDIDDTDSESGAKPSKAPKLRLREILFYDDKVAIFKARHGRL